MNQKPTLDFGYKVVLARSARPKTNIVGGFSNYVKTTTIDVFIGAPGLFRMEISQILYFFFYPLANTVTGLDSYGEIFRNDFAGSWIYIHVCSMTSNYLIEIIPNKKNFFPSNNLPSQKCSTGTAKSQQTTMSLTAKDNSSDPLAPPGCREHYVQLFYLKIMVIFNAYDWSVLKPLSPWSDMLETALDLTNRTNISKLRHQ